MENYIEIPFANGFKVIISKGNSVVVSLENKNGYIVSDRTLNEQQRQSLTEIIEMFESEED